MRARQRGNFGETFGFLLRRQKKVTKEEALNRTPARENDRWRYAQTRAAALSPTTCDERHPSPRRAG
jgi:hypothetical protein